MEDCSGTWQIVHIPSALPVSPTKQPTVGVMVSAVEPRAANQLIRRLNQISPLENLRHVKRIRKVKLEGITHLSIILCLVPDAGGFSSDLQELIDSNHLQPYTAEVCKFAANTKEEWEEQCKIWPTSYHPPTYNVEGINGFGDSAAEVIHKYMKMAINLAKSYDGSVVNAAVIVDPSMNSVVAFGVDETSVNPPPFSTSDSEKLAELNVSCINPFNWSIEQKNSTISWHPLRHAAMVAIESSANKNIQLFPDPQDEAIPFCKRQKTLKDEDVEDCEASDGGSMASRPYLCTGYDIFIVWEPCAMCSMALVHQRIRRIFFGFLNATNGALCSVHRLHGQKGLNHHYAVFRVAVPANSVSSLINEFMLFDFLFLTRPLDICYGGVNSCNALKYPELQY